MKKNLKIIPLEQKYQKPRYEHVPLGSINPLPNYQDPRKSAVQISLEIKGSSRPSSSLIQSSSSHPSSSFPHSSSLHPSASLPPSSSLPPHSSLLPPPPSSVFHLPSSGPPLSSPYVLIKKVKKKRKSDSKKEKNSLIWNPSGNPESKRVRECLPKEEMTEETVKRMTKTILGENEKKLLTRNERNRLFQETSNIGNFMSEFYESLFLSIEKRNFQPELLKFIKPNNQYDLETLLNMFSRLRRLKLEDPPLNEDLPLSKANFLSFMEIIGSDSQKETLEKVFNLGKTDRPLLIHLTKEKEEEEKKREVISMKAFFYNYKKYLTEKHTIKNLNSKKEAENRLSRITFLLNKLKETKKQGKENLRKLYPLLSSPIPTSVPGLQVSPFLPTSVFLRFCFTIYHEIRSLLLLIPSSVSNLSSIPAECLNNTLNLLQSCSISNLSVLSKFLAEFAQTKVKEPTFTLFELADFLYELKYDSEKVQIIANFIGKIKKIYGETTSEDLSPNKKVPIAFVNEILGKICEKRGFYNDIWTHFISNVTSFTQFRIKPFNIQNPEVFHTVSVNLGLEFILKYMEILEKESEKTNCLVEKLLSDPKLLDQLTEFVKTSSKGFFKNKTNDINNITDMLKHENPDNKMMSLSWLTNNFNKKESDKHNEIFKLQKLLNETVKPESEKSKIASLGISLFSWKHQIETDKMIMTNNSLVKQLDFENTSKSFFKENEDNSGKNEEDEKRIRTLGEFMEEFMKKNEEEKGERESLIMHDGMNLSKFIMQQKKDLNEEKQRLDQSNLKETIDTNYYKDQGVEIGKYNETSDKFLDYQLYLPQDYYNSLIDKDKDNKNWYIRPHHIETLTEHPLSHKDNFLGSQYLSYLEDPKKQKEKESKNEKENLISSLENQIAKLKENINSSKDMLRASPFESKGVKHLENFVDSNQNNKKEELLTTTYETLLQELRQNEKKMVNKKREEVYEEIGAPSSKWWEKKDTSFTKQMKKHDQLKYVDKDTLEKLKIQELY